MVLATVMGGVQERTREIGVLRAVGFRKCAIFSLLFRETGWVSLLSSLLGAGTGIAAAYLASPVFGIEHPSVVFSPANLARATRSLRLCDGRVEEDRSLRSDPVEPVAV